MNFDDFESCRKVIEDVVNGLVVKGRPPYIDREELIGECFGELPKIRDSYRSDKGASPETFLRHAVGNDAKNFIEKQRSYWEDMVSFDTPPKKAESGSPSDSEDDLGGHRDRFEHEVWRNRQQASYGEKAVREMIAGAVARGTISGDQASALAGRLNGVTDEEMANELGVTRQAVTHRVRSAIERLTGRFGDKPVHLATIDDFLAACPGSA